MQFAITSKSINKEAASYTTQLTKSVVTPYVEGQLAGNWQKTIAAPKKRISELLNLTNRDKLGDAAKNVNLAEFYDWCSEQLISGQLYLNLMRGEIYGNAKNTTTSSTLIRNFEDGLREYNIAEDTEDICAELKLITVKVLRKAIEQDIAAAVKANSYKYQEPIVQAYGNFILSDRVFTAEGLVSLADYLKYNVVSRDNGTFTYTVNVQDETTSLQDTILNAATAWLASNEEDYNQFIMQWHKLIYSTMSNVLTKVEKEGNARKAFILKSVLADAAAKPLQQAEDSFLYGTLFSWAVFDRCMRGKYGLLSLYDIDIVEKHIAEHDYDEAAKNTIMYELRGSGNGEDVPVQAYIKCAAELCTRLCMEAGDGAILLYTQLHEPFMVTASLQRVLSEARNVLFWWQQQTYSNIIGTNIRIDDEKTPNFAEKGVLLNFMRDILGYRILRCLYTIPNAAAEVEAIATDPLGRLWIDKYHIDDLGKFNVMPNPPAIHFRALEDIMPGIIAITDDTSKAFLRQWYVQDSRLRAILPYGQTEFTPKSLIRFATPEVLKCIEDGNFGICALSIERTNDVAAYLVWLIIAVLAPFTRIEYTCHNTDASAADTYVRDIVTKNTKETIEGIVKGNIVFSMLEYHVRRVSYIAYTLLHDVDKQNACCNHVKQWEDIVTSDDALLTDKHGYIRASAAMELMSALNMYIISHGYPSFVSDEVATFWAYYTNKQKEYYVDEKPMDFTDAVTVVGGLLDEDRAKSLSYDTIKHLCLRGLASYSGVFSLQFAEELLSFYNELFKYGNNTKSEDKYGLLGSNGSIAYSRLYAEVAKRATTDNTEKLSTITDILKQHIDLLEVAYIEKIDMQAMQHDKPLKVNIIDSLRIEDAINAIMRETKENYFVKYGKGDSLLEHGAQIRLINKLRTTMHDKVDEVSEEEGNNCELVYQVAIQAADTAFAECDYKDWVDHKLIEHQKGLVRGYVDEAARSLGVNTSSAAPLTEGAVPDADAAIEDTAVSTKELEKGNTAGDITASAGVEDTVVKADTAEDTEAALASEFDDIEPAQVMSTLPKQDKLYMKHPNALEVLTAIEEKGTYDFSPDSKEAAAHMQEAATPIKRGVVDRDANKRNEYNTVMQKVREALKDQKGTFMQERMNTLFAELDLKLVKNRGKQAIREKIKAFFSSETLQGYYFGMYSHVKDNFKALFNTEATLEFYRGRTSLPKHLDVTANMQTLLRRGGLDWKASRAELQDIYNKSSEGVPLHIMTGELGERDVDTLLFMQVHNSIMQYVLSRYGEMAFETTTSLMAASAPLRQYMNNIPNVLTEEGTTLARTKDYLLKYIMLYLTDSNIENTSVSDIFDFFEEAITKRGLASALEEDDIHVQVECLRAEEKAIYGLLPDILPELICTMYDEDYTCSILDYLTSYAEKLLNKHGIGKKVVAELIDTSTYSRLLDYVAGYSPTHTALLGQTNMSFLTIYNKIFEKTFDIAAMYTQLIQDDKLSYAAFYVSFLPEVLSRFTVTKANQGILYTEAPRDTQPTVSYSWYPTGATRFINYAPLQCMSVIEKITQAVPQAPEPALSADYKLYAWADKYKLDENVYYLYDPASLFYTLLASGFGVLCHKNLSAIRGSVKKNNNLTGFVASLLSWLEYRLDTLNCTDYTVACTLLQRLRTKVVTTRKSDEFTLADFQPMGTLFKVNARGDIGINMLMASQMTEEDIQRYVELMTHTKSRLQTLLHKQATNFNLDTLSSVQRLAGDAVAQRIQELEKTVTRLMNIEAQWQQERQQNAKLQKQVEELRVQLNTALSTNTAGSSKRDDKIKNYMQQINEKNGTIKKLEHELTEVRRDYTASEQDNDALRSELQEKNVALDKLQQAYNEAGERLMQFETEEKIDELTRRYAPFLMFLQSVTAHIILPEYFVDRERHMKKLMPNVEFRYLRKNSMTLPFDGIMREEGYQFYCMNVGYCGHKQSRSWEDKLDKMGVTKAQRVYINAAGSVSGICEALIAAQRATLIAGDYLDEE